MPDPRFPFSNFQNAVILHHGVRYPSVENFYVAMKTTDDGERRKISTLTPGQAKRYGRGLELRPGWEAKRVSVMLYALRQKFAPGSAYAEALLAYPGEIVELNTWHDRYWGRCTCTRCGGAGENRLGRLLMHLRGELQQTPWVVVAVESEQLS